LQWLGSLSAATKLAKYKLNLVRLKKRSDGKRVALSQQQKMDMRYLNGLKETECEGVEGV
jgi:hypothetical protein